MVGGKPCSNPHHELLHGSSNAYCMTNAVMARQWQPFASRPNLIESEVGDRVLHGTRGMIFQFVTAGVVAPEEGEVEDQIIFVDPGLNVNFIREDLAGRVSLTVTPTSVQIKMIDDDFNEGIPARPKDQVWKGALDGSPWSELTNGKQRTGQLGGDQEVLPEGARPSNQSSSGRSRDLAVNVREASPRLGRRSRGQTEIRTYRQR